MGALAAYSWPPDYTAELLRRQNRFLKTNKNGTLILGAKHYYKDKPSEFIEHWCITYDPRNASQQLPTTMPFLMFPRQREFVSFLEACLYDQENGLVEKSRDMGATWVCCAFSVWVWLFMDGSAVGWGSRKEQLVDKIGDPDSIFEKMRRIIEHLPAFLLPAGFNPKEHSSYMKLINPENGATITGEAGDNIGRGGRKLIYFKDESAHYERPEKIEAALGDNTDVQIDISSVHGTANVFARRREGGQEWEPGQEKPPEGTTRVFIMDWRHHPAKDQAWYDRRRNKAEREGLLHVFAQEVDRDYAAAVEGVVIPALWVKAAVDVHKRFPNLKWSEGLTYSALDVADGGGDLNAQGIRKGVLLIFMDKWAAPSTYQTTTKAILNCKLHQADELHYDCVGVGSGVKGECNRLKTERMLPARLKVISWNGGSSVLDPEKCIIPDDPESPKNKDLFDNLKAQAYWSARQRFEKTYMFVTQGIEYPVEEMVALDSSLPHHHELVKELSQPTQSPNKAGKIVVDKQPEGTKSPNLADQFIMCYHPWRPTLKQAGMW